MKKRNILEEIFTPGNRSLKWYYILIIYSILYFFLICYLVDIHPLGIISLLVSLCYELLLHFIHEMGHWVTQFIFMLCFIFLSFFGINVIEIPQIISFIITIMGTVAQIGVPVIIIAFGIIWRKHAIAIGLGMLSIGLHKAARYIQDSVYKTGNLVSHNYCLGPGCAEKAVEAVGDWEKILPKIGLQDHAILLGNITYVLSYFAFFLGIVSIGLIVYYSLNKKKKQNTILIKN